MPKFSESSSLKLQECHNDLQILFNEVIKYYDCTIKCGHRGQQEQDAAYNSGHSRLKYPNGNHNAIPSLAVDVAPYPEPAGKDIERHRKFGYFAGLVSMLSMRLKEEGKVQSKIRWGGDWDMDNDLTDNSFNDLYHFEIHD